MTITIYYNKLIRDGIPDIIEMDQVEYATRKANPSEMKQLLADKLVEEAKEYQKHLNPQELGDLYEVLLILLDSHQLSKDDLDRIREEKLTKRGGFSTGILLEWVEIKQ